MTYHPFEVSVTKPDGGEYQTWDQTTQWKRTYYVDGSSPRASDQNAGDEANPFKTINRAAQVLVAGERVVVRPGVYRECVRPLRGGDGPDAMIAYHADPTGPVVIKASQPAPNKWVHLPEGVWQLDLALLELKDADNPFLLENLPEKAFAEMPWAQQLRGTSPYIQTRGMVFQEGSRLQRVDNRQLVLQTPASHWTDRETKLLLVNTANGRDPNSVAMELTTRQAAIRPAARGLGFIEIKGFTVEMVGNGFPRPQEGAISVCGGHHWRIENNIVRDVNGVGIDIGNGWYGGALVAAESGSDAARYTIVRGNRVERTGVCGITGIPAINALIERNVLINNTIYPITRMYESAGIKTHVNTGTLIRQNLIINNPDNGVWMDWDNTNSRCTQNVIVDCFQGVFVEASVHQPYNMVDRNVIWRATDGIYEHDSWHQTFVHNLIGESKTGIRLQGTVTDRKVGDMLVSAGGHLVAGNLIVSTAEPIAERKMPGFPDNTIVDNAISAEGVKVILDLQTRLLSLEGMATLDNFCKQMRITHDLLDKPWPQEHHNPGPLPLSGQYRIDAIAGDGGGK